MGDGISTFALWLGSSGTADLIGLIGFAITIVGIVVAVKKASKAQTAAELAEIAAKSAERELFRIESYIDLSGVITAMEAIKTLHRESAWSILPDRYAGARKLLIGVRESATGLTNDQKALITKSIQNFSTLERQVEKNRGNTDPISAEKLNVQISDDIDQLLQILFILRKRENGQ